MVDAEERINQKAWSLGALEEKIARNRFSVRRGIPTYDVDKKYLQELLAENWIPVKEVLQILAEGFFIPYDISDTEAFETVLRSAASHKNLMVIKKEKWCELLNIVKNRPSHKWMYNNLDKIEVVEMYFEKIEDKLKEIEK